MIVIEEVDEKFKRSYCPS